MSPASGSLLWLILAPGTVAVLIPWALTDWYFRSPFLRLTSMRLLGVILILFGLALVLEAFARFTFYGRGTPAPFKPTERLVITGSYRYVRNPMYVAVVAIILGQAFLLGQRSLLVYALVVWCCFQIFVLAYEEPTLERRYGQQYEAYRRGVRRWLPRTQPWIGSSLDGPFSDSRPRP